MRAVPTCYSALCAACSWWVFLNWQCTCILIGYHEMTDVQQIEGFGAYEALATISLAGTRWWMATKRGESWTEAVGRFYTICRRRPEFIVAKRGDLKILRVVGPARPHEVITSWTKANWILVRRKGEGDDV